MNTFADIIKNADTIEHLPNNVATFTDANTPEGTFGATTKILGLTTTYLLRGEKDDQGATILGRIEADPKSNLRSNTYVGGGLKGGSPIPSDLMEITFRRMANEG